MLRSPAPLSTPARRAIAARVWAAAFLGACATVHVGRAAEFWISPAATSAAPGPSTLELVHYVPNAQAAAGQFHIWAAPEAGKTFAQISLNVRADTEDAIDFTSVTVHNPSFGVDSQSGKTLQRYEFVQDSASTTPISPSVNPDRIDRFQGFTFTQAAVLGVGLGSAAVTLNDPFYDPDSGAFLVATVDYEAVSAGSAEIFLQIGSNGMNYVGETSDLVAVTFGASSDAPLNALSQRGQDSATADLLLRITTAPADFNGDLSVDADDLDLWQSHFGATSDATFAQGDATGDGSVDGADFLIWQRHFGTAPAAQLSAAAIPEPSALWLAAAAALAGCRRARRSR